MGNENKIDKNSTSWGLKDILSSSTGLDIQDDELRVIGTKPKEAPRYKPEVSPEPQPPKKSKGNGWLGIILVIAVIIAAVVAAILLWKSREIEPDEPGLFEKPDTTVVETPAPLPLEKFGNYSDTTGLAYVETLNKTINDIPLTILIPHNASAELCIGVPDYRDKSIVLALQAADIRRDNKKIVGAFVLKGEPLAWGLSKKGYCAILEDSITVGVADNSPLFEQATEKGGYFFRQYPLVDRGQLVENEPKNKSFRNALCERAGEHFVVRSETQESFHDFAQALVDLGCENAIYLIGGEAYGFSRDSTNKCIEFSKHRQLRYRYQNFIIWKAE